ncbi:MAG: deoxyribonuclease IV [Deltaproteobacteria bacterium]|nr:MAG: deoxyribonuclease IV [Deltaproteobacteria bacterium]
MPLLGAHQSIAGGLHRALERGRAAGCAAVQLFTRSSRQWAARPLGEDDVRAFAAARAASVTHPGAHCGAGEAAGLGAAAHSLGEALGACRGYPATVALENTAGQGTQIGVRFDQLARLVAETRDGERLRVCVDTQHAFAAGYDMRSEDGYAAMVAELERTVGVERLVAFHLNDAKKGLGSRVDRHEHIGRGELGRGAFRRLLRDPHFHDLPMCLETPKTPDPDDHRDDRRNLAVLRRLLA